MYQTILVYHTLIPLKLGKPVTKLSLLIGQEIRHKCGISIFAWVSKLFEENSTCCVGTFANVSLDVSAQSLNALLKLLVLKFLHVLVQIIALFVLVTSMFSAFLSVSRV
ncbi:hypothetical protein PI125_g9456 [Phytophthora idaei]|nr:hypothetical protein PI125_g9456 [Phytophthora idaei]KAG3156423.1 hypothetical protein PI126_g8776 [Phytophthora idaei]